MSGQNYSTTLPKSLASGGYLVRHEIIALHLANEKGKAEFYPSCQQIKVGGSETGVPSEDQLLSFPGAYSDDDPGIFVPTVRTSYCSTPIETPSDLRGVFRSLTVTSTIPSPVGPSLPLPRLLVVVITTVRIRAFRRRVLAGRRLPRMSCHPLSLQAPEIQDQTVPPRVR